MKEILWLFHHSEVKNRKEDQIFASQAKNLSEHARFTSLIGTEITTILKIAVDNAILELCDSCDFFASPLLKGKSN